VCENEEEKILPTDGNFTIKTEFDKINNEKNNEGNNQEKEVIKYDLLISYECCDKKINYRYDVTDHVKKLKSNTQGQDPTVHNLGKIDVVCSEKKSNLNSDDGDYYST
uniref:Multi-drug resistance associated protein 2 n=1 Tax=Parastrongyloides trichosuri TaxID=131310 RepID=A0A0N4ZLY0_PARTI